MSKEKLKKSIKQAIENDPHKKDILRVSLFGSYAYGKPKADSDVDLLIEFKLTAVVGYFKLAQIRRNFMSYLKKDVDLVSPEALSRYFRSQVLSNAQKIYEQR